MECTEEFERAVAELEAVAVEVAASKADGGPETSLTDRYVATIDHIATTYPVAEQVVRTHAERVRRIRERNDEPTASNRIAAEHKALLDRLCDNYDPSF